MSESTTDQGRRYAAIVEFFLEQPGVTRGKPGKKGFGSSALRVRGKIFAMLSSKDQFVVKLPRERVDGLVDAGEGERFDPGRGRLMKEWFIVGSTSKAWISLAKEAMEFVGAGSS